MTARTGELPWESGVCEATSSVDYERVKIGEGEYLLPHQSQLRFTNRAGGESENVTTYSACHEFRADAELRFDDPETGPSQAVQRAGPLAPLSAGITMFLSLETPIDTDIAAAGDAVIAKLRSALHDEASGRRFPAGSLVRGRITRLERHREFPDYFLIGVEFRSIESEGNGYPLTAKFTRQMRKENPLPFAGEKQDYFAVRSNVRQLPQR